MMAIKILFNKIVTLDKMLPILIIDIFGNCFNIFD